jgi:hypothetical protein
MSKHNWLIVCCAAGFCTSLSLLFGLLNDISFSVAGSTCKNINFNCHYSHVQYQISPEDFEIGFW